MRPHDSAHVWRLWAVVVMLSLLEAVLFSLLQRFVFADNARSISAVYVAVNVFVFFAALLVFVDFAGRRWMTYSPPPNARNTRAELTHLFVHLLCLAYLRTACWFEGRAAMRWFLRS
jgi:ABC-type long-subunit fatty acid transport system fused permease/ATPase subunit